MRLKTFSVAIALGLILTATIGCKKPADKPETAPEGPQQPAATAPATAVTTAPAAPEKLSLPKVATSAMDAEHAATVGRLINGGVRFLLSARDADGGWSFGPGNAAKPAATALALKVLLEHPDFDSSSPVIKAGLDVLLGYQQKDGGIYDPKQGYKSYGTAAAVMALVAAKDPRYTGAIRRAVAFLREVQIQVGDIAPDGTKIEDEDPRRGGVGYGTSGVPNLSVLSWWMDAMHEAGIKDDDPVMQEAVLFLTALQNRSESNPRPVAAEGADDGGAPYDLKTSKAGPGLGGKGLRSYGSMTYAMFKSMLYAGVAKNDPRVRAAYDWIRRYWRLDSNPNMPHAQSQQGLYYYYHVFAKALRAWGQAEIKDSEGEKHNWRHELIDALAERVQKNGSWVNAESRWMERSPVLVTCYAVLALEETLGE